MLFASIALLSGSLVLAVPNHHGSVNHGLHRRISTDFASALEKAVQDAAVAAAGPLISVGDSTSPAAAPDTQNYNATVAAHTTTRFPALDFVMPDQVPDSHENWWTDPNDEYAFLGFSYEVTPCQSKSKMTQEFKDIRKNYGGRYIRMYGNCDQANFYDDVIDAAWDAAIGVHALIWFGWDKPDAWKGRKAAFLKAVESNKKAPFVVRALQFGSEPLFDSAISAGDLAAQVKSTKKELSQYGIPVTVSEMAYGYEKSGSSATKDVLGSLDLINIHTLPFFDGKASTASKSWPIVKDYVEWFLEKADGKKVIMSQNGWPSTQYDGVRPNSDAAVSDVKQEQAYFELLDDKCDYFKAAPGGGVGWFFHLYGDYMEPGYGLIAGNGKPKFDFKPKTSC